MSMETPVGLGEFPVTKFCMGITFAIPIIAAVSSMKYIFLTQFHPFIDEYHQYYRLFTFQLGCINESDAILLSLIWYNFRNLERLLGSFKYLNLISLLWVYTTITLVGSNILLNLISSSLFNGYFWNRLPSGGLPITLALFHFYKQYTPKIYQFQILLFAPLIFWNKDNRVVGGNHSNDHANRKRIMITLTDQFLINILIFLLLLNQGFVGIFCGFVSWIVGIFVEKGLFWGLNYWELPFIDWILKDRRKIRSPAIRSEEAYNLNSEDNTNDSSTENILTEEQVLLSGESGDELNGTIGNIHSSNENDSIRSGNGIVRTETPRLPLRSTSMGEANYHIQREVEESTDDEPVRPLRTQFFDVFRR